MKYFDGNKVIEVEADERLAAGYKEIQRYEDRIEKRRKRHESIIPLSAIEDERGYQFADLSVADTLEMIIEREELEKRSTKLKRVLASLTPEQKTVVALLRQGVSVTEIAQRLGVDKSAVSHMRKRIQEKIKKVL